MQVLALCAQVMQRTAAHRNIPAHNPQATGPEQAYVVTDMFPAGCLAALNIGMLLHASDKADLLKSLQDKRKVCSICVMAMSMGICRPVWYCVILYARVAVMLIHCQKADRCTTGFRCQANALSLGSPHS